jgi:hypothetical protein
LFPHERSLVSRYQDQPFVLLGVNADEDPEKVRVLQQEGTVTWRSWWDGNPGSPGKICREWGVNSFPILFLIDHKGLVRFVYPGAPDPEVLDTHLKRLLKEAQKVGTTT